MGRRRFRADLASLCFRPPSAELQRRVAKVRPRPLSDFAMSAFGPPNRFASSGHGGPDPVSNDFPSSPSCQVAVQLRADLSRFSNGMRSPFSRDRDVNRVMMACVGLAALSQRDRLRSVVFRRRPPMWDRTAPQSPASGPPDAMRP